MKTAIVMIKMGPFPIKLVACISNIPLFRRMMYCFMKISVFKLFVFFINLYYNERWEIANNTIMLWINWCWWNKFSGQISFSAQYKLGWAELTQAEAVSLTLFISSGPDSCRKIYLFDRPSLLWGWFPLVVVFYKRPPLQPRSNYEFVSMS